MMDDPGVRPQGLNLGVVGTSRKRDERRLPIHPAHLGRIDGELRLRMFFEHGYGERFGVSDAEIGRQVGGLRSRQELLAGSDVVVLAKPLAEDLKGMRPGTAVWGWPHAVQDEAMAQAAIDRRLTLIAWETMNHWTREGTYRLHVFHKNNEMAGYCSVQHALALTGTTGAYGRRLRAAVIAFGATARGAVTALLALGVPDITVLTYRDIAAVASPMAPARLVNYEHDPDRPGRTQIFSGSGPAPMAPLLAEHDIVVNCVLQDTDRPLIFVDDKELAAFMPGSLIVDVSCDAGMGFEWAQPTSFAEPTRTVGDRVTYYAVDHSPSYLWDSATWEISDALIPFLDTVMAGQDWWDADPTISRAIEIREGVVKNAQILSFQGRDPNYPHGRRA